MDFFEFPNQDKVDRVLDKISNYGINSLNEKEKDFLDELVTNDGADLIDYIVVEDDLFKFEFEQKYNMDDEVHYIGNLYLPNLELDCGMIVTGMIKGKIIVFNNGEYIIDFIKKYSINSNEIIFDALDFCNGIEYELDDFMDHVIQEIENNI